MGFPMPRQLLPLLTSASPPLLCFGYAFSREERIQCPLLFLRFSLLRRSVVAALLLVLVAREHLAYTTCFFFPKQLSELLLLQ
jgi:hypothetical protein